MRSSVNRALPLAALILLSGCGFGGGNRPAAAPPLPTSGPGADYPIVLGEPFTIGSTTYEPVDTLNYDAVGYASQANVAETSITAAHKTLPLPSYVEVTELENGRTILLRVERRGPMVTNRLIELSAGAAMQLGIAGAGAVPVRVRRVNPPEQERAVLRQGEQAALRMDTPKPLLEVLKRKLDGAGPGHCRRCCAAG
jgi:rare lipoprotein A